MRNCLQVAGTAPLAPAAATHPHALLRLHVELSLQVAGAAAASCEAAAQSGRAASASKLEDLAHAACALFADGTELLGGAAPATVAETLAAAARALGLAQAGLARAAAAGGAAAAAQAGAGWEALGHTCAALLERSRMERSGALGATLGGRGKLTPDQALQQASVVLAATLPVTGRAQPAAPAPQPSGPAVHPPSPGGLAADAAAAGAGAWPAGRVPPRPGGVQAGAAASSALWSSAAEEHAAAWLHVALAALRHRSRPAAPLPPAHASDAAAPQQHADGVAPAAPPPALASDVQASSALALLDALHWVPSTASPDLRRHVAEARLAATERAANAIARAHLCGAGAPPTDLEAAAEQGRREGRESSGGAAVAAAPAPFAVGEEWEGGAGVVAALRRLQVHRPTTQGAVLSQLLRPGTTDGGRRRRGANSVGDSAQRSAAVEGEEAHGGGAPLAPQPLSAAEAWADAVARTLSTAAEAPRQAQRREELEERLGSLAALHAALRAAASAAAAAHNGSVAAAAEGSGTAAERALAAFWQQAARAYDGEASPPRWPPPQQQPDESGGAGGHGDVRMGGGVQGRQLGHEGLPVRFCVTPLELHQLALHTLRSAGRAASHAPSHAEATGHDGSRRERPAPLPAAVAAPPPPALLAALLAAAAQPAALRALSLEQLTQLLKAAWAADCADATAAVARFSGDVQRALQVRAASTFAFAAPAAVAGHEARDPPASLSEARRQLLRLTPGVEVAFFLTLAQRLSLAVRRSRYSRSPRGPPGASPHPPAATPPPPLRRPHPPRPSPPSPRRCLCSPARSNTHCHRRRRPTSPPPRTPRCSTTGRGRPPRCSPAAPPPPLRRSRWRSTRTRW